MRTLIRLMMKKYNSWSFFGLKFIVLCSILLFSNSLSRYSKEGYLKVQLNIKSRYGISVSRYLLEMECLQFFISFCFAQNWCTLSWSKIFSFTINTIVSFSTTAALPKLLTPYMLHHEEKLKLHVIFIIMT